MIEDTMKIPAMTTDFQTLKGFTLMELMVVFAIVAILASAAAPAFRSVINNNAQIATTNELVSILRYARSYAVTHKRAVLVTPINSLDGSFSASSEDGGLAVTLNNADLDILTQTNFPSSAIEVRSDIAVASLTFDRLGRANPVSSIFTICDTETSEGFTVNMNYFGRTQIVRNADGVPLRVAC